MSEFMGECGCKKRGRFTPCVVEIDDFIGGIGENSASSLADIKVPAN